MPECFNRASTLAANEFPLKDAGMTEGGSCLLQTAKILRNALFNKIVNQRRERKAAEALFPSPVASNFGLDIENFLLHIPAARSASCPESTFAFSDDDTDLLILEMIPKNCLKSPS